MIQEVPLIRLSLTTVDLNDNPYYDTLSYTWGSPFWDGSDKSSFYQGPDSLRPVAVNNRILSAGTYGSFSTKPNKQFQTPGTAMIQKSRNASRSIIKRGSSLQSRMAGCIELRSTFVSGPIWAPRTNSARRHCTTLRKMGILVL